MNEEKTKNDEADLNAALASGQLPSYTGSTGDVYDSLIAPGTFGVVAAETGGGKTLLLCNLAAHALMQGKRVGIVCMDMGKATITDRLKWMLGDVPIAAPDAPRPDVSPELAAAVVQALGAIKWLDYSATGATPAPLSLDLPVIAGGVDVLLVDGIDAVDPQFGKTYDIEAVAALLAKLAADMPHLTIWTTSQIKVQASGTEIVRLDDLALTAAKGHRGALVVTLGPREAGTLWTACVAKDRNRQASAERQVYRLALRPSLRLELLPIEGAELPYAGDPPTAERFEFVGPAEDLPSNDEDEGEVGDGGDDEGAGDDAQQPLKMWHGDRGFVPLGRKLFDSTVFQTRNFKWWFWLNDLYQMAHPLPKAAVFNAPNTFIAITVARGEIMVSLEILAERWDCSVKCVRTFLDHQMADGQIQLWHVSATGSRERVDGMSKGTSKGRRKRVVAQVVKLCHYMGNAEKNRSAEEAKGHDEGHDDRHAVGI